MQLTPPTQPIFYLSVLLAFTSVFIEAMALTHVISVEYAIGGYSALLFAYLLLFTGTVSRI